MIPQYLKIVLLDGPRFIIRVTGGNARFLRGIEVDKTGDEVVPPRAHQRIRIIERTAIKSQIEMRMNNTYGWLEVYTAAWIVRAFARLVAS